MNLFACLSSPHFPILKLCYVTCASFTLWLEVTIPLCLDLQLEQFNMIENAISSNSLYSPCSTLNYSQAAMMGLTGSHGSLQDSPQLSYSSHGNIPNIILTGEQTPVLPLLGQSKGRSWLSLPFRALFHLMSVLSSWPWGSCSIPTISSVLPRCVSGRAPCC